MIVPFQKIPTYNADTQSWSETSFPSQPDFALFLQSLFKEPGEYNFDESTLDWNQAGKTFTAKKYYTLLPKNSKDWRAFWDFEKRKNRLGVIWRSGDNTWYLCREYYMLLNFLPITNKEKGSIEGFPDTRDTQYHLSLYEKIAETVHKHSALVKKRQMLSEQPHSEPVLGEYGWTTMGNVKIGDRLWNPDGTLTTILDKSFHENAEIYEFIFDDGRQVRCGIEHNWQLHDNVQHKDIVLNTRELIKRGILRTESKQGYKSHKYSINQIKPIEFHRIESLEMNPYILGVLIGDGTYLGNQLSFVCDSKDGEIRNNIEVILGEDYKISNYSIKGTTCLRHSMTYKKRFQFKDADRKFGVNPLIRSLKREGIFGSKSCNKSIPDKYKHASIKDRISLIQGLMDTDGYINNKGLDIHFTTCSKILAEDVTYILRSLGVKCVIADRGTFYRVRVSGVIEFDLFRLRRKLDRQKLRTSTPFSRTNLVSINKLDYTENSSCIVVDNPNHLYITRDFITTHNSYYHCAKLINFYWFEKTKRLKMMASDEDFIKGKNGSWMILEAYRDFLNEHTPWYRNSDPGEVGSWQQKIRVKVGGRWITRGNKSTIIAQTLKRDPSKSVGGPAYITFYEEAGIAPTMDITLQFMNPALQSGLMKVGSFIAAGSVGDLDHCKPLQNMIKDPDSYDIYKIPCRNYDDTGVIKECGLFIPEQYGMPPYIDKYGNSLVPEATEALAKAQIEWKNLPPEQYRLKMSQGPMNLKQAFDFRGEHYFPGTLIERRQQIIEDQRKNGTFKPLRGIMKEDEEGNPIFVPVDKLPNDEVPPEMGYPVDPKAKDKRGVVIVYQKPKDKLEFGVNFAGVDPIEANITTTSESLFSVSIVSRRVEVHKEDEKGSKTIHYEGGKLLAVYNGRYDDINDTIKQGELLIRWYKALSAVERNKPNFINHMRRRGFSNLLAKRRDMSLFKEVDSTGYDNDEYGIYLGSDGKANDIINENILEDITEELDVIHKINKDGSMGEVGKTIRGIDLIDDYWTLEELKLHQPDSNTDRRISYGLAKTLAKCFELTSKKKIYETAKVDPPPRVEGFSLLGRPPTKRRSLL